jgi:large subunit ribosomal protein L1
MSRGKKYQESLKKYNSDSAYELDEALGLVKTLAYAKFDETVDL